MLRQLLSEIRRIRPDLDLNSRIVLEAVLLSEGPVGSADRVSRFLGLHSRFKLGRVLKRDGLPSLRHLSAWALVLSWVERAERDGASLCNLAFRSHRHASACYRLVRETTGLRWAEVRSLGSAWVRQRILEHFPQRPCTSPPVPLSPSLRSGLALSGEGERGFTALNTPAP